MTYPYARMFALEETLWWYRGLRHYIRRAFTAMAIPPGALTLDAGCGTGGNLARMPGAVGLDFGLEALRCCRRRRGLTRLVCGDVNALPFRAGVFAAVLACDLFESREVDERLAVDELARVTVSGGALVVTVPAHDFLLSAHDQTFHTVRRFTLASCRRIFNRYGWEITSTRYLFGAFFPVLCVWRWIARRDDLRALPRWLNGLLYAVVRVESRWTWPWGSTLLVEVRRV